MDLLVSQIFDELDGITLIWRKALVTSKHNYNHYRIRMALFKFGGLMKIYQTVKLK